MIKALKYQLKYTFEVLFAMALGIGCYFAAMFAFAGLNYLAILPGMLLLFMLLTPLIIMQTLNSIYYTIALSHGATRKNYNNALQISKVLLSFVMVAVAAIVAFVVLQGYALPVQVIILLLLLIFFVATLGDFMGIAYLKFSRIVMIIFGVAFGMAVGSVGVYVGFNSIKQINGTEQIMFDAIFSGEIFTYINIASAVLAAVGIAISLLTRKLAYTVCVK